MLLSRMHRSISASRGVAVRYNSGFEWNCKIVFLVGAPFRDCVFASVHVCTMEMIAWWWFRMMAVYDLGLACKECLAGIW
jgi:hypothetical protein